MYWLHAQVAGEKLGDFTVEFHTSTGVVKQTINICDGGSVEELGDFLVITTNGGRAELGIGAKLIGSINGVVVIALPKSGAWAKVHVGRNYYKFYRVNGGEVEYRVEGEGIRNLGTIRIAPLRGK